MNKLTITLIIGAVIMAASILYMEWRLQSEDEVSSRSKGNDDA